MQEPQSCTLPPHQKVGNPTGANSKTPKRYHGGKSGRQWCGLGFPQQCGEVEAGFSLASIGTPWVSGVPGGVPLSAHQDVSGSPTFSATSGFRSGGSDVSWVQPDFQTFRRRGRTFSEGERGRHSSRTEVRPWLAKFRWSRRPTL